MSYRTSFSAIKGLNPTQILNYLNEITYSFKDNFKFNYIPIIALSLSKSENKLKNFTFIYPIYFDMCADLEINFDPLKKIDDDDSYTYIGNWDIPKLISKNFNVKVFSFEEFEGDIDYEIYDSGEIIYDFKNNYHSSYWEYYNFEEYEKVLDKNAKFIPKCNPSSSFKFSNSKIIKVMNTIFPQIQEKNLNFILDYMSQNLYKNKHIKKNKILFDIKSSSSEIVETYDENNFENFLVGCFLSSLGLSYDLMIDSNEILENLTLLNQNSYIDINTNIPSLKKRLS